jgi:hypothetical protein
VESKKSVETKVFDDEKKFLDDFLFLHVDEERKLIWGLAKVKDAILSLRYNKIDQLTTKAHIIGAIREKKRRTESP